MRLSPTTPLLLALMMGCEPTVDDTDMDSDTDTDTEVAIADRDADGIADAVDNCPDDANTDQADEDEDELGDACDECPLDEANDEDDDGECGNTDNCDDLANTDQADSDDDGIGDACDPCPNDPLNDADNDGVCGDIDGCPEVDDDQTDSDGDGIGDACDVCDFDADNDVDDDDVCGDIDICPVDADPNQEDADGDGFGDACGCDDGSYRDYTDDSCNICPAPGLDQAVVDFDNTETRYDMSTNTLRFALRDDVQIVSATATIRAFSFDEYGYESEGLEETVTGTVRARVLEIDLDDLQELDVYADGFTDVSLTLTDACGNEVTLDNLTIEATSNGTELDVSPLRYTQCGDTDLASALGNAIATGTTEGQGRDTSTGGWLFTSSPDVSFRWTAPNAGQFSVDTFGSQFDTVLYALPDGCEGEPLGADDDTNGSQSQIVLNLDAGETVVVVIAGYDTATGDYTLSINPVIEF